jgi:hypothetical protein
MRVRRSISNAGLRIAEEDLPMIERRLYYLQTRLDATPRGMPSPSSTDERHRPLGGRIHRLLGGRRVESAAGTR